MAHGTRYGRVESKGIEHSNVAKPAANTASQRRPPLSPGPGRSPSEMDTARAAIMISENQGYRRRTRSTFQPETAATSRPQNGSKCIWPTCQVWRGGLPAATTWQSATFPTRSRLGPNA